jgi:hypothetical protein
VQSFATGGIDRDGRVESFGAAPGEYEVLVHPSAPMSVMAPYRQNDSRTVREARMSLYLGRVAVKPLKSYDELATLETVKQDVPVLTASVKGNISIVPPLGSAQQNIGNLTVRLVGEQAQGSVSFNFPSEFGQNAQRQPLVFGESKKVRGKATPSGSFKFNGLPAGEYKLFVDVVPYRYSQSGQPESTEKKVPVPVQMLVVKDGEALDLGAVEFKPSAETLEAVRQAVEANTDTEPEDQIPVFQP